MTGFKISTGQKSLYLLQSKNPNFQYISHCAISIHGHLETAALKSAIENVIQRHEILRTEFPCLPGMNLPVQVINDFVNLSIEETDLTNVDTATQAQQISEKLNNANSVKFNLAKSPLHQISIIHLSLVEHILIINLSALCADTVSLKNIFQEISKYYGYYINNNNIDTTEEILQYADFCEYQNQILAEQEPELANIKTYWQNHNIDTVLNLILPGEKLLSNSSDFQPQFIQWSVEQTLQQQIEDIAKNHDTSISQILLTCWHILLSRLTDRRELVISYNCDGRTYEELDSAIGLFNKTIPVKILAEKNHPLTEILKEVNQSIELCKSWQDTFDWEKIFSNSVYSPFSFEFTEINLPEHQNSELEFSLIQLYSYAEKFKLKLAGLLTREGLKLAIHYDSNLLTEAQIQICREHLENLLKTAVKFPQTAIKELEVISDIENQKLRGINDYRNKCFHELFAERAEKTPEDIAIIYENQQLTYREINQRANQLAHYLQQLGVTSEVLVGLCLERSLETVVSILGILKAGGAYLPLDPKYPQERIAFIVEETKLSILLTQQNLVNKLPKLDAEIICLDTDLKIAQQSSENPSNQTTLENLAYVIFTSGSTGKPKGVQIPHRNISDYVQAMSQAFQLESKDVYLHTASFAFSSSVRQLMVPLSQGATVVIAAIEQIQTPLLLFEVIKQRQITIIDLVPSYWRTCTELLEGLSIEERNNILDNKLRLILSASEPLLSDIPRKWRCDFKHNVKFINMYGQTETTGIVCVYPIPDEFEDKITIVPIGRPIDTTKIYLLDEHLSPVPVGEIGELYISGSSLARSYFNRPDLTDEKFISNPFSDRPERLYKGGDLARCLPNGTIKFVGRTDYQVKIRGQRVELGEIESVISLYPGVKQTIVMGRDVSGDQQLIAYIVPKIVSNEDPSQTVSVKKLRTYLKEKLPEYMVPSTFLILPAFPLTPTGKIDRQALPAPEDVKQELEVEFVAPRNELELQLAKIWEQVLGVHPIGISNNFFELGGHSLIAVRLFMEIEKLYGIKLPLSVLFQAQTIEKLAQILVAKESSHLWSSLVLIQPGKEKTPLFCIHPIGGNVLEYQVLVNYLDKDQPVYGLQSKGLSSEQEPLTSVEDMAEHYIQEIQTVQPHGPYFLIGHSFGGKVALEIAQQLQAKGEHIQLLAVINTYSPNLAKIKIPLSKLVTIHTNNLIKLSPSKRWGYIWNRIAYRFLQGNKEESYRDMVIRTNAQGEISPQLVKVIDGNMIANQKYQPKTYSGSLVVFRSEIQSAKHSVYQDLGWSKFVTGNISVMDIPDYPFEILKKPHLGQIVAHQLQNFL